jgi:hypothetical protein
MKGQIFILTSVLILVVLLMLRNSMTPFYASSEDQIQSSFVNLKDELANTVDVSLKNREDVQSNLEIFIAFSKDVMSRRGYNESVQYGFSMQGNDVHVLINVTLESRGSYMQDSFIINRKVFS